jgi:glycosyltransferase involved in cell wall biosynthesis
VLTETPGVETILWEDVGPDTPRTDVVHRPCQVGHTYEFHRLFNLGERVVITHQDFIAYRNPAYFPSFAAWREYRQLTQLSLAVADRVVFFSKHACQEAAVEQLITPDRACVVYIGVDHEHSRFGPAPARPASVERLKKEGFVLCLGVDFLHKNRLFALRTVAEMLRRKGWEGQLVFAGPHASPGSSGSEERSYLDGNPDVAAVTVDLGTVSEGEKRWLLKNAALVMAPSVYEGFGLVPFEAAAAGVPCLFAPQASLAELLPVEVALIVPWDAEAAAVHAMEVLQDASKSREVVRRILEASRDYTWAASAKGLLEAYEQAVSSPAPPARAFEAAGVLPGMLAQKELAPLDPRKAWYFWRSFGLVEGSRRGIAGIVRRVRRRFTSRERR